MDASAKAETNSDCFYICVGVSGRRCCYVGFIMNFRSFCDMEDRFVSSTVVIVAEVVAGAVVIDDVDVDSDDNNDDKDVGGDNNISLDSTIESLVDMRERTSSIFGKP